ncbi:MAG: ChrR family anti-sigma-E factor [Pseudomonadota bacterium]
MTILTGGLARPAQHQVDDEVLAHYAAGTLPEALSLVVAAQASLCPGVRERLRELEAIGGGLLELTAGCDMALGSLEATMRLIAEREDAALSGRTTPEPTHLPRRASDVLPAPVQDYVGGGLDDVRWRPLGMGAKQAILHETKDASVRLLKIPAGCELPDHGHAGLEMTLVLHGAFRDGETRYERGDMDIADQQTAHMPIVDADEDCVCLVACEGRLKFSGLLPRIAQPVLRI